jgi:hypothetical protein
LRFFPPAAAETGADQEADEIAHAATARMRV